MDRKLFDEHPNVIRTGWVRYWPPGETTRWGSDDSFHIRVFEAPEKEFPEDDDPVVIMPKETYQRMLKEISGKRARRAAQGFGGIVVNRGEPINGDTSSDGY